MRKILLVVAVLSLAATADADQVFEVKGTVMYQASGSPAVGLIVKAFHKDSSSERILGSTIADSKGYYRIGYLDGSSGAGLIVRVFDNNNNKVYESQQIFNARASEAVNINIPAVYTYTPKSPPKKYFKKPYRVLPKVK